MKNSNIQKGKSSGYQLVYQVASAVTALCAIIKPREVFESAASRHFQKLLWVLQKRKALYYKAAANFKSLVSKIC